jgi:hypothetical protein
MLELSAQKRTAITGKLVQPQYVAYPDKVLESPYFNQEYLPLQKRLAAVSPVLLPPGWWFEPATMEVGFPAALHA